MALPPVADLERAALTAVPAPRVAFDGPFVVRAFLGGTGRANATSSIDPSPDPALEPRIARIEARYRALGLVPRFRSTPLDPPGLEALLRARGYVEKDETVILAAPIARIAAADPDVTVAAEPDDGWIGIIATTEYQTEARRAEKRETAGLLAAAGGWFTLWQDGQGAASLSVVSYGAIGGFFDLAVRPEFRRRGLAQRITRAGAAWAAAQGAKWLYAQVAATNAASRGMCGGLGMEEAYRYRYLVPKDAALPSLKFS